MQIGDRRFLNIPGDPNRMFELPPLLITKEVEAAVSHGGMLKVVEDDRLIEPPDPFAIDDKLLEMIESAKSDMAVNLSDKYVEVLTYWHLGEFILHWVSQCEITFKNTEALRCLLGPGVWPRADRKNIAELLTDKSLCGEEELKSAVGTRLSYRVLPPAECFSDQFLFYLEPVVAKAAYDAWASKSTLQASLPPERFHFEIIDV